jgi:hypothetical protein
VPAATGGTGTLNIFSEFTGTTIYLDEIKQGEDVKTVNGIPAGNHYLKVMKDGVGIFGELVAINPGQTTTVLVKNDGQVAEKILEGKTKEREEFNAKKLDVIYSSPTQSAQLQAQAPFSRDTTGTTASPTPPPIRNRYLTSRLSRAVCRRSPMCHWPNW